MGPKTGRPKLHSATDIPPPRPPSCPGNAAEAASNVAIDTRAMNIILSCFWYPNLAFVWGNEMLQPMLDRYAKDIANFNVRLGRGRGGGHKQVVYRTWGCDSCESAVTVRYPGSPP